MVYLDAFLTLLREGINLPDAGALVLRLGVGVFFAISGWNKLTCTTCHGYLRSNLTRSGIPCVPFAVWWVAGWEFLAGVALALGLFTGASAFVLFVICVVAFLVSHRRKIAKKNPVHRMDAATEYLCMFDVLLLWMTLAIMAMGPGAYSLDRLLWTL
jgi:putative oxidoreductase